MLDSWMAGRSLVELCRVRTADGVLLDAMLSASSRAEGAKSVGAEARECSSPVDVFLLVHGTGSNFYAPGVLESFARQANDAGVAVLRINTRGHDGMASNPGPANLRRGGAAFEKIEHATLDLRAWCDFLTEEGFAHIVLVGHSMGGVKAILSQAEDPHPRVVAIVGISPPRFHHESLTLGPGGEEFLHDFQRAAALVEQGQGDTLIPVRQPLPLILTAAGFVDKYGPSNRYDYVPQVERLSVPLLLMFGTESEQTSGAFFGVREALAAVRSGEESAVEVISVPGANTSYSQHLDVPFELASEWLIRRRL